METCKDCDYGNVENGTVGSLCPIRDAVSKSFKGGCAGFVMRQTGKGIPTPPPCQENPLQGILGGVFEYKSGQSVKIAIKGIIRGGKNNMVVTRTGLHFPRPEWAKWRNEAVEQVKAQFSGVPVSCPCAARIEYWAGDRKRRDVPAVLDSIWHVLEKASVVDDDALIKSVYLTGGYDKDNPRAEILLFW